MAVAIYLSTINSLLSNICDDRKASDRLCIGNCVTYWHATPTRRKHMLKLPYQAKTGPILNWLKHKKGLLLPKDFSVLHPPISTPSVHIYFPSSTLLHGLLSFHPDCYTYFLSWCHQWLVLGLIQPHIQFVPGGPSPLVQQPGDKADHSPPFSTKVKNAAIP
jgi:hypothetical protein